MNSFIFEKNNYETSLSKAIPQSEEVLYTNKANASFSNSDVEHIMQLASKSPRGRLRFCLHSEVENPLHEMIIVHPLKAYVPPHKHNGQSESIIVLRGVMDLVIFDDLGEVSSVVPMGSIGTDRIFHHRLEIPQFHTMLIHSNQVVFTEIKTGPYVPEETIFAEWAPKADDKKAVNTFLNEMFRKHKTVV